MDSAMIASLLSYGNIAIKLAVGLIGFLWVLRTTNRCQLAQMTPVDRTIHNRLGDMATSGIRGKGPAHTHGVRSEDDSGKAYSCCDKRQVFTG